MDRQLISKQNQLLTGSINMESNSYRGLTIIINEEFRQSGWDSSLLWSIQACTTHESNVTSQIMWLQWSQRSLSTEKQILYPAQLSSWLEIHVQDHPAVNQILSRLYPLHHPKSCCRWLYDNFSQDAPVLKLSGLDDTSSSQDNTALHYYAISTSVLSNWFGTREAHHGSDFSTVRPLHRSLIFRGEQYFHRWRSWGRTMDLAFISSDCIHSIVHHFELWSGFSTLYTCKLATPALVCMKPSTHIHMNIQSKMQITFTHQLSNIRPCFFCQPDLWDLWSWCLETPPRKAHQNNLSQRYIVWRSGPSTLGSWIWDLSCFAHLNRRS